MGVSMLFFLQQMRWVPLVAAFFVFHMTFANGVTLEEIEQLAVQNDPIITKYQAIAQAAMTASIADNQWPDPTLRIGQVNLPYSPFSFDKEPMTQMVIGVQQVIPSKGLLGQQKEQKLLLAEVYRAQAMDRALQVLKGLRQSWMDVYYQTQAAFLVKESQEVFSQFVKITQYQYRAGRGKQQDVVQAQLELSFLQDHELQINQKREVAIAELANWVGASLDASELSVLFPDLPALPILADLESNIEFHPAVSIEKARLGVTRKGVAIARAKYKPKWMVDLSYGLRFGENMNLNDQGDVVASKRSDFLSAMVSVELPFFTKNRQDQRLNARGHEVNAAADSVDVRRRVLQKLLTTAYANWMRLGERLEFYKTKILPQGAQFSESSRKAYQSRISDFSDLTKARLRELDSHLLALALRVERAKAHYDLQYIAGEAQ